MNNKMLPSRKLMVYGLVSEVPLLIFFVFMWNLVASSLSKPQAECNYHLLVKKFGPFLVGRSGLPPPHRLEHSSWAEVRRLR